MTRYEYKVVPAPKKGQRARGVKGAEGRFAHALEALINEHAADGWEYQRTDTLPSEERQGLTRRTTITQNVLIFRRTIVDPEVVAPAPAPAIDPGAEASPPVEGRAGDAPAEGRAPAIGGARRDDQGPTPGTPGVAAE